MVGIDALSRTLFGKAAHGLDEREAAIAAALVRAPNAKAGAGVAARPASVLRKPCSAPAKVDCEGLDLFAAAALQRKAFDASEGVAPHLARELLALRQPQPFCSADTWHRRLPLRPERAGWGSEFKPRPSAATLRAPLQRFALQTLHPAAARTARPPRGRRRRRGAGQRHRRSAGLGGFLGRR